MSSLKLHDSKMLGFQSGVSFWFGTVSGSFFELFEQLKKNPSPFGSNLSWDAC
jgi:hypothetical protein